MAKLKLTIKSAKAIEEMLKREVERLVKKDQARKSKRKTMAFRVRWKSRLGNTPGSSFLGLVNIADQAMINSVPKIARLWQREAKKLSPVGDTGNLKRLLKIRPIRGSTKVTLHTCLVHLHC